MEDIKEEEEKEIYKRSFFMQYDKEIWDLLKKEHKNTEKPYSEIIQNAIAFYFKFKNRIKFTRRTP